MPRIDEAYVREGVVRTEEPEPPPDPIRALFDLLFTG